MKSRILKRWGAAGLAAALALAGLLVLPFGRGAAARSEDEDKGEGKLQGTWRVQVTLHPFRDGNCQTDVPLVTFNSFLTFASGHTLIEVTSSPAFKPGQRTPGLGVWSRTDEHTFSAPFEAFILFPSDAPVFKRGVQRITQTIVVNGDDFAATARSQFFDTTGMLYDSGCSTAVGHRFESIDSQEDGDKH
jgi:hypothetical protein